MQNKGLLVVLSGPSGSGKDTVLAEIFKSDLKVIQSISMTTRAPRNEETDGIDYSFVSEETFLKAIDDGEMLEYARYGKSYYGTPKAPVDKWLNNGKTVVLKIDVQGAGNIRSIYPDAISIFITPPNMTILEKRLRNRGSEDEDDIQRRLKIARDELERIVEYDYVIINDDLGAAVEDIKTIVNAELLKVSRRKNILSEVSK